MVKMNFDEFEEQVSKLCNKEIKSKDKRKRYQLGIIKNNRLPFLRPDRRKQEDALKVESLDLKKLHNFYLSVDYNNPSTYTTTTARKHGLGGKQSPAVAVILSLPKK